jgi:EmrB/QacA subfamily drug resistance transporter
MIKSFTNRYSYKWQVLLVVMIGTFMAVLDSSIVNVSLPAMMADFGSSVDDIAWVVTGYMLSFSVLMPLTAWLRDRVGHKQLFIGSVVLFTLGSMFCGLAWNLPSLIVARVIQAFGAGAITPTGMAMISETFEPRERGKAMGYWGLGIIMGPAIGPTLGGILTRTFGWRSIFTINLPVGIICILLAMSLLKKDVPHPSHRKPFDLWGFLFLSLFLVAFLLGLSKGEQEGWTSAYILTCFGLSIFGFGGFLLVENIVPNGIVDLSLFKSSVFSVCMLVNTVRSIALFGSTFLLPVFMQRVIGWDEIRTGLVLLPSALAMAVMMPIAGRMADRIGPRWPSIFGLAILAYFMFSFRNLNINTTVAGIIWPTIIRSVGLILVMSPIMTAALNASPRKKAAAVSSLQNLIQQVGGSLGIAILTTVLTIRTHFHMSSTATQAFIGGFARQAVQLGLTHRAAQGIGHGLLAQYVGQTATVAGFQDAFLFGTVLIGIAVLPALLLPKDIVMHKDQQVGIHSME